MEVLNRAEDGLKREYKVFVSAEEIENALLTKLKEQAAKTRMSGFRPGKVPLDVVRRLYGATIKQDAVRDLLSTTSKKIISDEKLMISFDFATNLLKEDENGIEYTLKFELIPTIDLKDMSSVELTKHVAEVTDEEISAIFDDIRKNHKNWIEGSGKDEVKEGNKVTVDLLAKIKLKKRSSVANSLDILVGDPNVMEDFWKPLLGKRVGDIVDFVVNYPKGIKDKHLAGKKIEYSATVKKIMKPSEFGLDDTFAKSLGYESFAKLCDWAKARAIARYDHMSTEIVKRDLLEKMSEMYDFDVPNNMFAIELAEVRRQIGEEARNLGYEMTAEVEEGCKKIAADRVRLGFVVAEIAKKEKITVSREEIGVEISNIAALYPGHERAIWDVYSRGAALNAVVGPILERKVVDHLLGFIKVKEKKCSVQQLIEIDEEPFDFFKEEEKKSAENNKKEAHHKKTAAAKSHEKASERWEKVEKSHEKAEKSGKTETKAEKKSEKNEEIASKSKRAGRKEEKTGKSEKSEKNEKKTTKRAKNKKAGEGE